MNKNLLKGLNLDDAILIIMMASDVAMGASEIVDRMAQEKYGIERFAQRPRVQSRLLWLEKNGITKRVNRGWLLRAAAKKYQGSAL